MGTGGFHEGELAVQRQAGVEAEAARLARILAPPNLAGGAAVFLRGQSIAALTARDVGGRRWVSLLAAEPGFLDVRGPTTLRIHARPGPGDPLHELPAGQPVGLVAMDYGRRRRFRVNGTLVGTGAGLTVEVDQAYGNCPQYIRPRSPEISTWVPGPATAGSSLAADDLALVRAAESFYLGTGHPTRGSDASHRGGPTGFVEATGTRLSWIDLPGNNLFNSLGNLAADPAAALLFTDLSDGRTVQVSGTAALRLTSPVAPGDTGRRVDFTVQAVVSGHAAPVTGRITA